MSTQLTISMKEITEEIYPVIFKEKGLEVFKNELKSKIPDLVYDMSIKKDQAALRSVAYDIAQSKTLVDKHGRKRLKQLKEEPKIVEKELREWIEFCDKLEEETRRPLTEFENREKERTAKHEANLAKLEALLTSQFNDVDEAEVYLFAANQTKTDDSCEEFLARYISIKQQVVDSLTYKIEQLKKRDAEKAELEKLRKENEERDKANQKAQQARRKAKKAVSHVSKPKKAKIVDSRTFQEVLRGIGK